MKAVGAGLVVEYVFLNASRGLTEYNIFRSYNKLNEFRNYRGLRTFSVIPNECRQLFVKLLGNVKRFC